MPLKLIQKETRTHEQKQQSLGNTGWYRGNAMNTGDSVKGLGSKFCRPNCQGHTPILQKKVSSVN